MRLTRLTEWIADWAWTTSAEEVAATAARHGVTLSGSTVVRILQAPPDPTFPLPRVGTADTVPAWLREHPSIEVVSRNRAIGYANAAQEGAPRRNKWPTVGIF